MYCKNWWHEACSSYERGVFVCNECIDDSLFNEVVMSVPESEELFVEGDFNGMV
jgi:hypothetical protein